MVAQETTAPPSYDPENLGAWTGQLPNPELVDQLPPESPKPAAWPKVFQRMAWADGVVKSQRYRGATAAVFHRITTRSGTPEGCTESLGKMAEGLGVTRKTVKNAVKTIRADGYILVEGHLRSNYVCVPDFDKGVGYLLPQGRVLTTPGGGVTTTPKRTSSSKGNLKKKVPGVVDAKRVDDPGPEDGVTTGVEFFSLEEEGVTGVPATQPKRIMVDLEEPETTPNPPKAPPSQDIQDFVDRNLSDIPKDSEMLTLAKHCWPEWGPHWGGGWAAAWSTWTKDASARKKFRTDVVAQLAKVGLPKPMAPDADNDRAWERAAKQLDASMAKAAAKAVKCAGCGFPRQLKPGETHCHPCRKLSEAPKLVASLPGPAIWKTDDYEKLLEENIRRYQEADGLAPGDPKVEAVGAALGAG